MKITKIWRQDNGAAKQMKDSKASMAVKPLKRINNHNPYSSGIWQQYKGQVSNWFVQGNKSLYHGQLKW